MTPVLSAPVPYTSLPKGYRDVDPLQLKRDLWPHVQFYKQEREIIYSFWDNKITVVPACNKGGKDFVAGFCAPVAFLTRHPCRGVTTSAKDDHLRVLWGEIGYFIQTSRTPLDYKRGGPLVINHHDIRKIVNRERCPLSYLKGMVASPDSIASMQGHHIKREFDWDVWKTFFISDESSSVPDEYWAMAQSWFHRALVLGNPWPCSNFFYKAVKGDPTTKDPGGNITRSLDDMEGGHYKDYRKVIHIRATDSPNVRLALAQIANGKKPTNEILTPGVKEYREYLENRKHWNKIQQCVSLDGEFYEGAEQRVFPQEWIKAAHDLWDRFQLSQDPPWTKLLPNKTHSSRRIARAIGIDPAEGGDDTTMAAVDEYGLIELVSEKTPDTNVIVGKTIAFARKHLGYDRVTHKPFKDPDGEIDWSCVIFDRGGGKQHADRLRAQDKDVSTVAFGDGVAGDEEDDNDRSRERDIGERKSVYKNRRAQMYGEFRELLDPSISTLDPYQRAESLKAIMGHGQAPEIDFHGFSLPGGHCGEQYEELARQMRPIPLTYSEEGQMYVIPKNLPPNSKGDKQSLTKLLGCSPDELDAVVLAVHGLLRPPQRERFIVV